METVFVYGSLRAGMYNHKVMGKSEFVAEGYLPFFEMFQVSSFPAIVPGHGCVKGEVYLVDDATLARLDRLEGHPRMYKRELVTVQAGDVLAQVWAYVWQRSVSGMVPVPAGDWVEFFKVAA